MSRIIQVLVHVVLVPEHHVSIQVLVHVAWVHVVWAHVDNLYR